MLRTLVAHGGKVVDTWPRNAANDAGFGRVINERRSFATSCSSRPRSTRSARTPASRSSAQAQRRYRRKVIDLAQIFSLTDLDTHWPSLRSGRTPARRAISASRSRRTRRHAELEQFLRRERPDFVQINYSITERAVGGSAAAARRRSRRRRADQPAVHERHLLQAARGPAAAAVGRRVRLRRRGRSSR